MVPEGVLYRTVMLFYGDTPAPDYLRQMTDVVVHTWDVARAVGADERLDPDLVATVLDRTDPDALAGSGLLAAPADVPADAHPPRPACSPPCSGGCGGASEP